MHGECVDFAAADCKENATYSAGSEHRHVHHWREGNLPANSKCAACRRACCSAECLTGYRCEWCGSTVCTKQDNCFSSLRATTKSIVSFPLDKNGYRNQKSKVTITKFQCFCVSEVSYRWMFYYLSHDVVRIYLKDLSVLVKPP